MKKSLQRRILIFSYPALIQNVMMLSDCNRESDRRTPENGIRLSIWKFANAMKSQLNTNAKLDLLLQKNTVCNVLFHFPFASFALVHNLFARTCSIQGQL